MRRYLFSDEAGDFNFSRQNASRHFIVCAVDINDCSIGHRLLDLRRELAWDNLPLGEYLHCAKDQQVVRDRVFNLIQSFDLRIYAQILEKSKALPRIRPTKERFYQHAWYYLFHYCMPKIVGVNDELIVTTASIGTRGGQKAFSAAIEDVLSQTVRLDSQRWRAVFWPAASDPCIWIADYCTWAIQRKWERQDRRSYDLIKEKIVYEYDTWAHGRNHHY